MPAAASGEASDRLRRSCSRDGCEARVNPWASSASSSCPIPSCWSAGRVLPEFHLSSGDPGGAFCLLVDRPPPGWSLPPHLHRGVAETIHIVEGEFDMEVDGERSRLTAGQTLHVPPGVVHAGGNVGAGRGRRILLFSPAG